MLFGRSCTRSNARASADPRSCDDLQYFPPDFLVQVMKIGRRRETAPSNWRIELS
jgi:hypothetical protein